MENGTSVWILYGYGKWLCEFCLRHSEPEIVEGVLYEAMMCGKVILYKTDTCNIVQSVESHRVFYSKDSAEKALRGEMIKYGEYLIESGQKILRVNTTTMKELL